MPRPTISQSARKRKPRRIVAFDTETDQNSRIILLLASDAEGRAEHLHNPDGIGFEQAVDFLLRFEKCLCIGYVFEYDVQMLLRLLPPQHLQQLRMRGSVLYRRYRIRHVPRKRIVITNRETNTSVCVWDVSGWTQCSFSRLLDDFNIGTREEREFVRAMKARRDDWSATSAADLIRYTTLECRLLAQWFGLMLDLHERVGVSLRSYCGGGSTAAAFLRRAGWKPPEVPEHIQQVAEQAYFGGRSETSRVGWARGQVFGYDINSAYPAATAALPEIAGARWMHARRWEPHAWGFWRVRWRQRETDAWGLFPVRGAMLPGGRRSLSLLYPHCGEGWFHSHEVRAALDVAPEAVEVLEGWIIDPRGRPFAWIEEAAAERLRLKAAGAPEALILKYGLNSVYGKLAQHTGKHPYQCIAYAAAITAATRAALLRAAYPHGHEVLLVATDGILSLQPLDVRISPALGDWEASVYEDAFLLQAGVYWCGGKIRTRGIDGRSLTLDAVAAQWERRGLNASVTVSFRRVLSYRAACAQGKPERAGLWEQHERTVSFDPAPRRRPWRRVRGAMLTLPARVEEYRMQAALDALMIERDVEDARDDDLLPEWELD